MEEKHEKYDYDFKLVEDNYKIINDIKSNIEPHWKNGNTAKMGGSLKKVIKELASFFNSLSELADRTRKDINQISSEKSQCSACFVITIFTCPCAIVIGNLLVIISTCTVGVFALSFSLHSFFSLHETHEKSQFLKRAIMEKRKEINKARASLEVVLMRAYINLLL